MIFSSGLKLNCFSEVSELFIDGTFKIAPKKWYQLVNIFGFIKKNKFYLPLTYILLSSKSEELYCEVFYILKKAIYAFSKNLNFFEIRIMADFELGLRSAIKKSFEGAILVGCYFHYCKSIWSKIKKLKLFKKKLKN